MIRSATHRLLSSLAHPFSSAKQAQPSLQACRYSSGGGRSVDGDDLRTAPHIPSVSIIEDESAAAAAASNVNLKSHPSQQESLAPRQPTYLQHEDVFSKYPPRTLGVPREVWVESLEEASGGGKNKDLIRLHPDVFSVKPRLDILWTNVDWQKRYKTMQHDKQRDRYEMHYGGRPWPQKGGGKARHASRTSPIWLQGGKTHPNRGIRGHFFMPDISIRISGLTHALSAKLAQDDLRIVENLRIPSKDPEFIEQLIDERCWGISALFVDVNDIFPEEITTATESIPHVNLMPCYGLNVHSMLKHKTLVLTVDAATYIQNKILYAQNRFDYNDKAIQSSTTGIPLR